MKKQTLMALTFLLIAGTANFIIAEEKDEWSAGAFPVEGTTDNITTKSSVSTKHGATEFTFAFKDDKSNMAFAQFPIASDNKYAKIAIPIKGEGTTCNIQVWLESSNGWKFQDNIVIKGNNWKEQQVSVRELDTDKVRNLRLIIQNKNNPKIGKIALRQPKFKNKLSINEKIDGLETLYWYPLAWDDNDGKKRASVSSIRETIAQGKGVKLNINYDFPDKNCTQVELKLFELNKKLLRKKMRFILKGDKSANEFQIWLKDQTGKNHQVYNGLLNKAKAKKINCQIPEDVTTVNEMKLIIVKKQTGKGRVEIDSLQIK